MSKHSKTNHLPEYPYALGHRHFFSKHKFMQTKPPQNPVQTVVKTLGDDSLVYIQYIITALFFPRYLHGVGKYDTGCTAVPCPFGRAAGGQVGYT